MNDEDWLEEDNWISDEKTRQLSIPGIVLPGLRDLRIQFIALIEFDLFLGPIVHINELSRGSSYINKLRNHQTVSEVYAGVARSDVDEQNTLEDEIAVFRYHHEGKTEIVSVLLISCIPGTDLDQVKELGSNALFRSKGDPSILGSELSKYLREQLVATKKFRSDLVSDKIVLMDEHRISKALDLQHVKGILVVDYQSRYADFRLFPTWYGGKEIVEIEFINYLDKLATSMKDLQLTSLIYQDIVMLVTRIESAKTFVVIIFEGENILELKRIGEWFLPYANQLAKLWRFTSSTEVELSLELLNSAILRGTNLEDYKSFNEMALRASKLRPTVNPNIDIDSVENTILPENHWQLVRELDGTKSVIELSKNSGISIIALIPLLEWSRLRELIMYFEE